MPTLLAEPNRAPLALARLQSVLEEVEAAAAGALGAFQPGPLRAQCLAAITAIPETQKDPQTTAAACRLVEAALAAGWIDQPAPADLVEEANTVIRQGWKGLLAAFLIAPSWQIAGVPAFERTPLFLWRTLAAASFRLPAALTVLGQADALAARQLAALHELVRIARANAGSAALREAAAACFASRDCLPLANARAGLEKNLELRAALRALLARGAGAAPVPLALPRSGRRLKVGVVVAELRSSRGLRSVLPWCEFLDSVRFHPIVFAAGPSDSEWLDYLAAREIEFRGLVGEPADQMSQLREEALDVAVYSTAAATAGGGVSALIASRAAPLQLTVDDHGFRSGEPFADAALEEDFGDGEPRDLAGVMMVPTSGVRLMSPAARGSSHQSWTRAALGFAEGDLVLACAAPFALLSPEWADRAAEILAAVPAARLLIHSAAPADASAEALSGICSTLQPALNRYSLDAARLSISNEPLGAPAGVAALLGVADLYLNPFSPGDQEGAQLALQAGVPILALRPTAAAASLLRLGLSGCVAEDAPALVATAVALGLDQDRRASLARQLALALAEPAACQDPVALGECAGARIESAFDAIVAAAESGELPGSRRFVNPPRAPLPPGGWEEGAILLESGLAAEALPRLTPWFLANPADPRVRPLFYTALIQAGQTRLAAEGLAVAVDRRPHDAEAWRLLARAQLWLGHREAAAASLRASLRLQPKQSESWKLLEELVQAGGHRELADEVGRLRAALTESPAAQPELAARKCLYFSPVGRGGKQFLDQIVERFPADQFDFLVIAYDDTDFSDLAGRVEVIRDRGQKWRLAKKHLTPEKVSGYDYVFIWDDDLDPKNFDPTAFVEILRRNQLDIAQPSLTADSHSFHPITVAQPNPVGRLTNFVEIMCPVYSAKIWPSIYPYIEPDINELGWGYDLIPLGRKAIVDCMSVRHTRPGQSAQAGAAQQFAAWARRHGIVRPTLVNLHSLS